MEIQSFFVNIDSLDGNYVMRSQFSGSTVPLWNHARNQYQSFELFVQRKESDYLPRSSNVGSIIKDKGNAFSGQKYKCKYCNICIPTMYRREHDSSAKHKTHVRIAELVLQRINAEDQYESDHPDEKYNECFSDINPEQNTYFCEPCAVAVSIDDKATHNSTKSHKNSVLRDKYLQNLQKVYEDSDYLIKEAQIGNVDVIFSKDPGNTEQKEELNKKHIFKNLIRQDHSNKVQQKTNIAIAQSSNTNQQGIVINKVAEVHRKNIISNTDCKVKHQAKIINTNHSPAKEDEAKDLEAKNDTTIPKYTFPLQEVTKPNANRLFMMDPWTLEDYNEKLNESLESPTYTLTFHMPGIVCMTTEKGWEYFITFEDFNGLNCVFKDGKKFVQCRICMKAVKEAPEKHIYDSEHLKKTRMPIQDVHCYRQIDDTFKHCIVCNENLYDAECHTATRAHLDAFLTATQRRRQASPNWNVLDDMANKKGIAMKDYAVTKPPPVFVFEAVGEDLTPPSGKTYCKPCKIQVLSPNYRSHAATKKHKILAAKYHQRHGKCKLTVTTPLDYKLRSISERAVLCKVCQVKLTNSLAKIHEHFGSRLHKNNYQELLWVNKLRWNKDRWTCDLCKVDFKTNCELDHVQSSLHRKKLLGAGKYRCNLCDITLKNSHNAKTKHEESAEHRFSELAVSMAFFMRKVLVHHHYVFNEKNMHSMMCGLCHVEVRIHDTKEHLESNLHIVRHQRLMSEHRMVETDDGYWCCACSETVAYRADLSHVKSSNHQVNLWQNQEPSLRVPRMPCEHFCSLCKCYTPDSKESIRQHEMGFQHTARLKMREDRRGNKAKKCLVRTRGRGVARCEVCEVEVPANSVQEHVRGLKHNVKLAKLKIINED